MHVFALLLTVLTGLVCGVTWQRYWATLLGFKSPGQRDREGALECICKPDLEADLERARANDAAALLADELFPRGVVGSLYLGGLIHTLPRPILAYRSARVFLAGGKDKVPSTVNAKATRIGAEGPMPRRNERCEGESAHRRARSRRVRDLRLPHEGALGALGGMAREGPRLGDLSQSPRLLAQESVARRLVISGRSARRIRRQRTTTNESAGVWSSSAAA